MGLRALFITPEILAAIKVVVDRALAEPTSQERIKRILAGLESPPSHDDRFRIVVPLDYRCAFTVEEVEPSVGLIRHLSVSVPSPGKFPNPAAMATLMAAFGFSEAFCTAIEKADRGTPPPTPTEIKGTMWIEEGRAINVVEALHG